jgi:site-specific DNA-methyltransferase (adenine-specific)
MKPFLKEGYVVVYNADIITTNAVKPNSVDLIVTSPPYGIGIEYGTYDDSTPYDKYLEFSKKWLRKCYKLAKSDGRLCLNIPLDKNKPTKQSVCADLTTVAKRVGWKYEGTVVWNEQNMSRGTAWGTYASAWAPHIIAPVEVIVVFYKRIWKKAEKGTSDITTDEFKKWAKGVWEFSGASKTRIGHPAPFPVELPRRCIKFYSYVTDTVLDPFCGSGTTLLACLETGRAGIGVEINKEYCELAARRIQGYIQSNLPTVIKNSAIQEEIRRMRLLR